MPETIGYTSFVSLFKNQASFLDVRAPIEFEQGSIPGSVNLPLLNDDQREAVGKTYRKYGKDEAIYLGQRLISGNAKNPDFSSGQTFVKTIKILRFSVTEEVSDLRLSRIGYMKKKVLRCRE